MPLQLNQLAGFGVAATQAGGGGGPVNVTGGALADFTFDPDPAAVTYELQNDGEEWRHEGPASNKIGDWVVPGASAGLYEARLTVDSGTAPSGSATSTWLALSGTRGWTLSQSGAGSSENSCTIEIRRASDGAVMDSATVTMNVSVIEF